MDNERIEEIAKELERLIEEENPEVLEKLKDPEYSKEILVKSLGKKEKRTAVVELTLIVAIAQLTLTIAQTIKTGYEIKRERMKIEELLKDAGLKEEKAKEIVSEVIKSVL
jgi:hypothetical protein